MKIKLWFRKIFASFKNNYSDYLAFFSPQYTFSAAGGNLQLPVQSILIFGSVTVVNGKLMPKSRIKNVWIYLEAP